jgi:alpha-galactosidase
VPDNFQTTTIDVALPDAAFVVRDYAGAPESATPVPDGFAAGATRIELTARPEGLAVSIESRGTPLVTVALRWRNPQPDSALILGDAWERSYGDLQWRHRQPERVLPWYWLGHDPASGETVGMGVRVRPAAFCSWSLDEDGTTLWLDVSSGGVPVELGDRRLEAATIVEVKQTSSAYESQAALCRAMCDDPLLPDGPLVGANNWYYAYGADFGPAEVLTDARTIVELADGHPVRPFSVVDAGWSVGGGAPGGPWTEGIPGLFDDMPGLASGIRAEGARPGIWIRPAALTTVDDPTRLRRGPRPAKEEPLDLSRPENLEQIGADIARLTGWGFELIKHDFSTFDHFARWGFQMGPRLTEPGWAPADRSLTNAEILLGLYRTIRQHAGDAMILGCNVVGHLAAGLVHAQRTGDDTSGRAWERTRQMGVNTLAFRLAQHRRFFVIDADCVPVTAATPWRRNREFLDLVARSGTALFVSVDPGQRTPAIDADLKAAVRIALDGGEPGGIEPLDWLTSTSPRDWRTGSSERSYHWLEPYGVGSHSD